MTGIPTRTGAVPLLAETLDAGDSQVQVTNVLAYVYGQDGSAAVNGQPGIVSTLSPASQVIVSYLWDTSAAVAGDYTYFLRTSLQDGRVVDLPEGSGEVILISRASKFDRWVSAVRDWMVTSKVGEAQELLSWKQVREGLLAAVEQYSRVRPRLRLVDVPLAAGVFEYPLWQDFAEGVSEFRQVDYPVDPALRPKAIQYLTDYNYDLERRVWWFIRRTPGEGEAARVTYAARHTLTDTEDTLPANHFPAIAQFAAGLCLQMAASRYIQLGNPNIGGEVVEYRSKADQARSVATDMLKEARMAWGSREPYIV